MLSRHGLGAESEQQPFDATSLHRLGFLPQQYTFQSGLRVTVRCIRTGEDGAAFRLFQSSAERGEGFSAYDVPSLPYFRRYMLEAGPCVILEETAAGGSSGEMVGWLSVCPSWFTRTRAGLYAEPSAVLDKRFQAS